MKKSEQYYHAMLSVMSDNDLSDIEKLEIVGTLIGDRSLAAFIEKREEEKKENEE